jgi:hypothetical protein
MLLDMVPPELAGVYRLWWLVTIIGEAAQRVKPREDRLDEAADPPLNVVASIECPTERTRAHGRKEEGPAMNHVGIDVHKHASQICMIAEGGEPDRAAGMHRRIALGRGAGRSGAGADFDRGLDGE